MNRQHPVSRLLLVVVALAATVVHIRVLHMCTRRRVRTVTAIDDSDLLVAAVPDSPRAANLL
jgi:hypothetical protein